MSAWLLIALQLATVSHSLAAWSYDGEQAAWNLTSGDGSIRVGGTVPGGVYSDLYKANVLKNGDFYYRYNDFEYRWVVQDNWTYSTSFEVDKNLQSYERVALIFEGLDTVAAVSLNSKKVGSSENMFVRYLYDVKDQINGTTVNLEVNFESPVEYSKRKYNEQAENYTVPPKCVDPAFKGECHANHIRKMQASFSWDWGPAFPNSGIWKNWQLAAWNTLRMNAIMFEASPTSYLPSVPDYTLKPGWNISVTVVCDAAIQTGEFEGTIKLSLEDIHSVEFDVTAVVQNYETEITLNFNLEEGQVDLWWPNGFGSQPLYELQAVWKSKNLEEESVKSIRVGFRTVELNQDFVDPNDELKGRHYRVFVNNVFMFMKGSNWIPAHVLPEMVTEQYTRYLLKAAKDTYQNCIRVWGGGIYETDKFYEIADEYGILIWQDLMFACSMYPVGQQFLDTVSAEVRTQIRRLQHHPSILLWAANNENEVALRQNWYGTQPNFEQYKADYIQLYVDTIRPEAEKLDQTRPFVVSSPNNGIESEEEGHIAKNPYSTFYGDVHYYNYFSDAWLGHQTPRTRFASEYGFQSWPVFRTMKNATTTKDWSRSSAMMYHRQHHPGGQEELALQIGLHMHLPIEDGSVEAYEYYLYLSQIHQAMAIKIETEFYRRGMSEMNQEGEGYTSGALYWQLNDIWQGASWASIEYKGRWKMLHYYVKKFFDPILITMFRENEKLIVYQVSDLIQPIENLNLVIGLHRYDQFEAVYNKILNIDLNASSASLAVELDMWDDLEMDKHCMQDIYDEVDVCFVVSHLEYSNGSLAAPDNFLLFGQPKDAHLPKATVEVTDIKDNKDATFTVSLRSNGVALFVWLEVDQAGVFSDNGFLMTTPSMDVIFYADENTTVEELSENISVTSLTDTYTENRGAIKFTDKMVYLNVQWNDGSNVFPAVVVHAFCIMSLYIYTVFCCNFFAGMGI